MLSDIDIVLDTIINYIATLGLNSLSNERHFNRKLTVIYKIDLRTQHTMKMLSSTRREPLAPEKISA